MAGLNDEHFARSARAGRANWWRQSDDGKAILEKNPLARDSKKVYVTSQHFKEDLGKWQEEKTAYDMDR